MLLTIWEGPRHAHEPRRTELAELDWTSGCGLKGKHINYLWIMEQWWGRRVGEYHHSLNWDGRGMAFVLAALHKHIKDDDDDDDDGQSLSSPPIDGLQTNSSVRLGNIRNWIVYVTYVVGFHKGFEPNKRILMCRTILKRELFIIEYWSLGTVYRKLINTWLPFHPIPPHFGLWIELMYHKNKGMNH